MTNNHCVHDRRSNCSSCSCVRRWHCRLIAVRTSAVAACSSKTIGFVHCRGQLHFEGIERMTLFSVNLSAASDNNTSASAEDVCCAHDNTCAGFGRRVRSNSGESPADHALSRVPPPAAAVAPPGTAWHADDDAHRLSRCAQCHRSCFYRERGPR